MATFDARKARILAEMAAPGPDASPKGSIDTLILPLITRLNEHPDVVTTSSCSGRVSVFLEAAKRVPPPVPPAPALLPSVPSATAVAAAAATAANAGIGGKGDGGRWLFVAHDPVVIGGHASDDELSNILFGGSLVERASSDVDTDVSFSTRLVHVKFESMILHVQTRNLKCAHALLAIALSCGFRESGIMNPALAEGQCPMLAIRSAGLSLDAVVGLFDEATDRILTLVDENFLRIQMKLCNLRFQENQRRIYIFQKRAEEALFPQEKQDGDDGGAGNGWEDKETRRLRKREEGLRRQREMRPPDKNDAAPDADHAYVDLLPVDSILDPL